MNIQTGNFIADTFFLKSIACCFRQFIQLPDSNLSIKSYSFIETKQTSCHSQTFDRQSNLAMDFVCTQVGNLARQQPEMQHVGVNFSCSMKNPRKSPDKIVNTITRSLKSVQQDLADFPFFIEPKADIVPQETHTAEEASFRLLLHNSLSRKAPQGLRERIKNKIKSMPD